jgi:hypothetical protein
MPAIVTPDTVQTWVEELDAVHVRLGPRFARRESGMVRLAPTASGHRPPLPLAQTTSTPRWLTATVVLGWQCVKASL